MARRRLVFDTWPAAIYAIGDVHGCLRQLRLLEAEILDDGEFIAGEKWMLTLGDYIDRGPDSAGVIEHLLQPVPAGWKRISLVGNHEQMMLDFLRDPMVHDYWFDEGGLQTLQSYGIELTPDFPASETVERGLPQNHLEFIKDLSISVSLPGWYFVHAGIRPGIPLARQKDEDLIFIRSPFLEARGHGGIRVVHGHTPGREPVVTPARIGIDTHCFLSGRLTAVRVTPDGETQLFSAVA